MVETDVDRLVLLTDFGVDVVYTPQGGASVTIRVIFDDEFREVSGGEVDFALHQPKFMCRTVDVPAIAEGDAVVYNGISYEVTVVMTDGTGMTAVMLEVV